MPTVKGKQRKYIELLLKRKDVFGSLPTGFRKSLIYQLYPSISEMLNGKGAHMLVVSALKAPRRTIRGLFSTAAQAIFNKQFEERNNVGISAAEVGISEQEDLKIFHREYSMIFGSAEMLEKSGGRNSRKPSRWELLNFSLLMKPAHLRLGENLFPVATYSQRHGNYSRVV